MALRTATADAGVARLAATFPLPERVAGLPADVRRTHRVVLEAYLASGEPPAIGTLDSSHLDRLTSVDAVVVTNGAITGAYPFSSEPTGHAVVIGEVVVGAMCSLDALAVGPVFDVASEVYSSCAVTGAPIRIGDRAQVSDEIFMGIHFADPSSCAATSLCRQMVFLAGEDAAATWAGAYPGARAVYTLTDAIDFAERFFAPVVG